MNLVLAILVIAAQWAAGGFVWWLLAPRARLLEILGGGLALGTAMSALSGVVAWAWLGAAGASLLPVGVVAVIAASYAARRGLRKRTAGSVPSSSTTSSTGSTGSHPRVDRWEIGTAAVGIALGASAIAVNLGRYPLDILRGASSFHQDMVFFQPLSRSLALVGPDDSIFMAGFPLRYHWLSYAWAGDLDAVAGTEPFLVLTRLLPLTALIAAVLLTIAWMRRLTSSRWAGLLAVVLLVSGGYVGATYGTILNFDSPSQELSTVWMLGLTLALWRTLGSRAAGPDVPPSNDPRAWHTGAFLVVIALLSAAATGGKVSASAVVLAGWALVVLVGLVRRESFRWWALAGAVAGLVGAAWMFTRYISGSAQGGGIGLGSLLERASSVQGLNPMAGTIGVLLGTMILALAIAGRWAGLAWLIGDRQTRWHPGTVFGNGLAIVGLVTVLLLSGGLNDTWFALAASAPLCVLSAWGVQRAVTHTSGSLIAPSAWQRLLPWLLSGAAGVLLLGLVLALWTLGPNTGTNLRWAGPPVAFAGAAVTGLALQGLLARRTGSTAGRKARVVAIAIVVLVTMAALARVLGIAADRFGVPADFGRRSTEFSLDGPFLGIRDAFLVWTWSADQAAAGAWLAAQPQDSGLVATNQTRSPLVSMLSGRQTLVSAVQYQVPYGPAWRQGDALVRDGDSWRFIQTPSTENTVKLCEQGVRWVWVDPTRTSMRDWSPYAATVFERPGVLILRLSDSLCGKP